MIAPRSVDDESSTHLGKVYQTPEPASKHVELTTLKRWQKRRNIVIAIAAEHGCSQRMLADVFDIAHSRVAAIIKEYQSRYGKPRNESPTA